MASQLAAPVTFTSGTTIVSDDVDANFAANRTAFNALLTGTDQLAGGLTANGSFTVASGGLTVTLGGITVTAGGLTVTAGDLTVTAGDLAVTAGDITMAATVSKIIPGATSWGVRNNADGADNIIITDAGAVTFRSTVGGISTLTATTLAGTLSTAAQTNVTSLGTLTALQVDNVNINGNTISTDAGTDLLITPLAGQQIVLDGTIVVDAGVVTGATSITSTTFVGALTGNADTATTISDPLVLNDGSVSAPTYSWSSNSDCGMYLGAASEVWFTIDGLANLKLGTNRVMLTSGGTVASPGFTYSSDLDTGVHRPSANTVGFSAGGVASIQADDDATARNTRMLVYDVDNATLERVTVGAAESGGVGFKVLRIPN